ncbi:hypothetical protein [uncultured Williamsia sp.]|uniref:hypothetical protein n=1 Tax=uncultured Williamsia sp. TaxID=259311 RepID=UPI002619E5C3|nr:hypothetical protein [uncultured Williamsia sp.]
MTLDDLVLLEPTIHEVLEFRRQAERSRRTLHITAPARCFGATVPARHARVTINLDDPAVEVSGAAVVDRGVVTGIATQVSVAQIVRMIDDCGLMMPAPIAAGTPAEDVRDSLFVVLVLDEDS